MRSVRQKDVYKKRRKTVIALRRFLEFINDLRLYGIFADFFARHHCRNNP